jgi:hypothetical protein
VGAGVGIVEQLRARVGRTWAWSVAAWAWRVAAVSVSIVARPTSSSIAGCGASRSASSMASAWRRRSWASSGPQAEIAAPRSRVRRL